MKKYLVALAVGGVMENPEISYQDFQIITAENEKQACAIYDKKNDCSYYYGSVIKQIYDEEDWVDAMRIIIESDDAETAHHNADKLLCDVLEAVGFNELVSLYRQIPKWYS